MLTRERKSARIGPRHHGRAMALDTVESSRVDDECLYELAKGVIEVSQIPGRIHLAVWQALRDALQAYKLANPGHIDTVA